MFQSFNLLPTLTVFENIALPLLLAGGDDRAAELHATELIDRMGLAHRRQHYPQQLSGGEQQRAAIARAVVHTPALVIADEPTGNLDSENGARVLELMVELNRDNREPRFSWRRTMPRSPRRAGACCTCVTEPSSGSRSAAGPCGGHRTRSGDVRLFRHFIIRHLVTQRLRAAATVFGIAVGVAVIVAIRMANASSVRGFEDALDAISGTASLEIESPGVGIDETRLFELGWLREFGAVAPNHRGRRGLSLD